MISLTTPLYWDCECVEKYVHPKDKQQCFYCLAEQAEQPDSHILEVAEMQAHLNPPPPAKLIEKAQHIEALREHAKNIQWITSDVVGAFAISLEDMNKVHIDNSIKFLQKMDVDNSYILERQGVYTKLEWIYLFRLELFYRGYIGELKEIVIDTLSTLFKIYPTPVTTLKALPQTMSNNPPTSLEPNTKKKAFNVKFDMSPWMTEELKEARNVLCKYARRNSQGRIRRVEDYSNSGLYQLAWFTKKAAITNKDKVVCHPFTEKEWHYIAELEQHARSKNQNTERLAQLKVCIPAILEKYNLKPASTTPTNTNIVAIKPRKSMDSTLTHYVYRLNLQTNGEIYTHYAQVSEASITFVESSPTLMAEKDAQNLSGILSSYNKDQTFEFGYSSETFVVTYKENYLIFVDDGVKSRIRFTDNPNAATVFSSQKEGEDIIAALPLIFAISSEDVAVERSKVHTDSLLKLVAS